MIRLLHLVIFVSCFALPAQTPEKPAAEPQATTAADVKIKLAALKLKTGPLRTEQLAIEAKAWQDHFAQKAKQIADLEVQALTATGATKDSLLEDITAKKSERTDIQDRVEVVLSAWTAKGGKAEDIALHKKYLASAAGFVQDWFDIQAVWKAITGWLTSANGGVRLGINFLLFLATLLVFRILSRIAGKLMTNVVNRMKGASGLLRKFLVNFVTKFVSIIGFVVALTMLGVDVGPFLAVIGAAGFIIGFALQGTLNNFAAGIMILLYRPFDVGDVITAADTTGKVDAMSMSATTVKTPDNQIIIIPNGKIWGGIITNITGSPTRRIDLVFGIGYTDDIAKAQEILLEAVTAHPLVLKDPEPLIRVDELADSSVNFVVRPWSKTGDYWEVRWDLTREIKERFDAAGISIPFPQQDIHVHQVAAAASS